MLDGLKVLKRDNKKVDFNGEKIAIAIKKSFDSREDFIKKYTDEDINKVYLSVLDYIYDNFFEKQYIKVEEIQDIIEKILIKLEYNDVYGSFSNYRDKRAESRKMFLSEPKQHKMLKAIEKITLKQDWVRKDNISATDIMFNYGKTISEEFANAFLINSKYSSMHESGQIYISSVNFYPMGTTESCVIDINRLFEKGFNVEDRYYKSPSDIMSYLDILSLIIRRNSEDQHGEQGIPNFDIYLKKSVIKTFKEEFKNKIFDFLDLSGFLNFVDFDYISKEISKLDTIVFDVSSLYKHSKEVNQIKNILDLAYKKSIESTNEIVSKSINNFLSNSYFKIDSRKREVTINLGTDISLEGKIISKNLLLSLDKSNTINIVFNIKKGINLEKNDPNFDLFELACYSALNGNKIGFSFLDAPYNLNDNSIDSDVFYFGSGLRIFENINGEKKSPIGRGVLSKTYINLARIGIKNTKLEESKEDFFLELNNTLDIVINQLFERFNMQSDKKTSDFQFLIGEGIYMDSKGLKPGEKIKKSIKNGVLGIGIVGLDECIKSLKYELGYEEILNYIKDKVERYKKEYSLNFVLIGPNEKVSNIFINVDRAIYGDIKGITDKEIYNINFKYNDSYFQNIFDGGYLIEKDIKYNTKEELIKYITELYKTNIGYVSIKKEV